MKMPLCFNSNTCNYSLHALGRCKNGTINSLLISNTDLDVQIFAGPEVHDVDVEVVVGSLRQQLPQGKDLPWHRKHCLIRSCAMD